jgi:hypothetical protein
VVAVILAGAFGVFGTAFGAFITQRGQRTAAQEERVWTRQAETYLLMLQHHGSGMVDEDIETASEAEWAIRDELTAQANAFASDVVLKLWQESARANLRLNSYAEENWTELTVASATWEAKEDAYASDAEFRGLRQVFTQPWPAGPKDKRRDQVIYYQYRADRARRTLHGIDEQVAKAAKAVAGLAPVKRNRYIQPEGAVKSVNRELEEKAAPWPGSRATRPTSPPPQTETPSPRTS